MGRDKISTDNSTLHSAQQYTHCRVHTILYSKSSLADCSVLFCTAAQIFFFFSFFLFFFFFFLLLKVEYISLCSLWGNMIKTGMATFLF